MSRHEQDETLTIVENEWDVEVYNNNFMTELIKDIGTSSRWRILLEKHHIPNTVPTANQRNKRRTDSNREECLEKVYIHIYKQVKMTKMVKISLDSIDDKARHFINKVDAGIQKKADKVLKNTQPEEIEKKVKKLEQRAHHLVDKVDTKLQTKADKFLHNLDDQVKHNVIDTTIEKKHEFENNMDGKLKKGINSVEGKVQTGRDVTPAQILSTANNLVIETAISLDKKITKTMNKYAPKEENEEDIEWSDKGLFHISHIVVVNIIPERNECVFKFHGKNKTAVFKSQQGMNSFFETMSRESSLIEQRKNRNMEIGFTSCGIPFQNMENEVAILIEIVAAMDLPVKRESNCHSYVTVQFDGKSIHRTKVVEKDRDPFWTLTTGSLFLLKLSLRDLFSSIDGLVFLVYNRGVKNDSLLGAVCIGANDLYNAAEERIEHPLQPYTLWTKVEGFSSGYLVIRCRHATEYDRQFMDKLSYDFSVDSQFLYKTTDVCVNLGKAGVKTIHKGAKVAIKGGQKIVHTLPGTDTFTAAFAPKKKRVLHSKFLEDRPPIVQYRVRPHDPLRPKDETMWLSKSQIEEEAYKPPRKWIDVGSGSLARIFLEILGCDDLPNLDFGSALGNLTDAYVQVIYEDVAVKTDVIDDCLRPRWMPWANRSFLLHTTYPTSPIFLGVFDHDSDRLVANSNFIGKVSVHMALFRPDTEYLLTYDLMKSTMIKQEKYSGKNLGTITIRLRIEIDNPRDFKLATILPSPSLSINTNKKNLYKVNLYTCKGSRNMEKFDLKTIKEHVDEIIAFRGILYFLALCYIDIFLWRSFKSFTIRVPSLKSRIDGKSETETWIRRHTVPIVIWLPFHSIIHFSVAVCFVEHPQYIPSILCLSVLWILIIMNDYIGDHPNPWLKGYSLKEHFLMLIYNKNYQPAPLMIKQFEGDEATKKHIKERNNHLKAIDQKIIETYNRYLFEQDQIRAEEEVLEEKKIKIETSLVNVMKIVEPYIYPIQQFLGTVCHFLRLIKNILVWREQNLSFFITLGSVCLSILFAFVPWGWLLPRLIRISVYTFFGPWMKIVDLYLSQNDNAADESRRTSLRDLKNQKRDEKFRTGILKEIRIQAQERLKVRDIRKVLFGKYTLNVPIMCMDRYSQLPLPTSTATPLQYKKRKEEYKCENTEVVVPNIFDGAVGQHLKGVMIPAPARNFDPPISETHTEFKLKVEGSTSVDENTVNGYDDQSSGMETDLKKKKIKMKNLKMKNLMKKKKMS